MKLTKILWVGLVLAALGVPLSVGTPLQATPAINAGWKKGRETGFPIPRFVSLKSAKAHMRVGPSLDYATSFVYAARGLPMEIIEEYGNWRRVRDEDGATGWMFAPLLSGRRTAVVGPWMTRSTALHAGPSEGSRVVARLAARVRLNLAGCDGSWCKTRLQDRHLGGYVQQSALWGVYPGEVFD